MSSNDEVGPWNLYANYFIRTATFHLTGKLVMVTDHELVLEHAAWVADSGRFTNAVAYCEFAEVEMFPAGRQVIVGRQMLIDAVEISSLPSQQK